MLQDKIELLEKLLLENNITNSDSNIILFNAKYLISQNIESLELDIYEELIEKLNTDLDIEIKKLNNQKII